MRKLLFALSISALTLAPLSGALTANTAAAQSNNVEQWEHVDTVQLERDLQETDELIEQIHEDIPENREHLRDLWELLREKLSRSRARIVRAIEEIEEKIEKLIARLTNIETRITALESHDDHDDDDHGDDDHGDAAFFETDEHACLHVAHGPSETITAAHAAVNAGGADLSKPHTRFDLTLPSDSDGHHGYTSYTVGEDAIYAFYLTEDAPLSIFNTEKQLIASEKGAVTEQDNCPDSTVRYAADLLPGTYTLLLGPTGYQNFSVVIEEHADHDHGDDHGDNGDHGDDGSNGDDDHGDDNSGDDGDDHNDDDDHDHGDDDDDHGDDGNGDGGSGGNDIAIDPDLDEHACLHVNHGPERAVTASSSMAGAPDISRAHTRFDISLSGEGYVTYTAYETVDYVFYLTENVPLYVYDADGTFFPLDVVAAPVQNCSAAAIKHIIYLSEGSYTFKLGPTSESFVSFVAEKSEHSHDEGDDHDHGDDHGDNGDHGDDGSNGDDDHGDDNSGDDGDDHNDDDDHDHGDDDDDHGDDGSGGDDNNDNGDSDEAGFTWSMILEKIIDIFTTLAGISHTLEEILVRLVQLEQKVQ